MFLCDQCEALLNFVIYMHFHMLLAAAGVTIGGCIYSTKYHYFIFPYCSLKWWNKLVLVTCFVALVGHQFPSHRS